MRVSAAEFIRNCGAFIEKALSEPVTITREGRDRLVVLSVEEYQRLKQGTRRVYAIEEMTPAQVAALEQAEVPSEYAHLDEELKDWTP